LTTEGLLTLRGRFIAECELELLEPLHIGRGRDPRQPIDLPILRDAEGKPVIPGSTLKGFFRSYLARLLYGMKASGLNVLEFKGHRLDISGRIDSLVEQSNDLDSLDKLGLLDKIFGIAGRNFSFASTIIFTDANIVTMGNEFTEKRTHVSIDLVTDVAKPRMLVTIESIKEKINGKQTKFKFKIIYNELGDPRFKDANTLFYLLLLMLNKGIDTFLGGWKSRGYGYVRIKLCNLEWISIKDMILGNEPEKVNIEDLNSWIKNHIKVYENEN